MRNFILALVAALSASSAFAAPFYACGTPSIREVDMGAPVQIVELTYPVDESGATRTVALTGGTNDEINSYLSNLRLPLAEGDVLCVSGTEPVEWAFGVITHVSSALVQGVPAGVSVGN